MAAAVERVRFIRGDSEEKHQIVLQNWNLMENKSQAVGLSENDELKVFESVDDLGNLSYKKYQQLYRGIPVYGSMLTIVTKDNKNIMIRGNFLKDINLTEEDLKPSFSPEKSIAYAQQLCVEQNKMVIPVEYVKEKAELMIYYYTWLSP